MCVCEGMEIEGERESERERGERGGGKRENTRGRVSLVKFGYMLTPSFGLLGDNGPY